MDGEKSSEKCGAEGVESGAGKMTDDGQALRESDQTADERHFFFCWLSPCASTTCKNQVFAQGFWKMVCLLSSWLCLQRLDSARVCAGREHMDVLATYVLQEPHTS